MLYFVPTPIGNLGDITLRALEILQSVDMIYAEDTRRSRQLLNHFDIKTKLHSYHEHNKHGAGTDILAHLRAGKDIALVSDAGMPCISDPGVDLAALCVREDIAFTVLPGPSAFATAFAASAFPADSFCFLGFLPKNKSHRRERLESATKDPRVQVLYESPHALVGTLESLLSSLGDRKIFVGRELTKIHEEYLRGTIGTVLAHFKEQEARGEFVLVIEGAPPVEQRFETPALQKAIEELAEEDISAKRIAKILADLTGENKKAIYNAVSEFRTLT